MKWIIAALFVGFSAPIASAQIFVVGGGLGSDCFKAAQKGDLKPEKAEEVCSKALKETALSRANRAATYVNRGILRMRNGKYETALADYKSAIRINTDLAEAYINHGAAQIYLKDYKGALASLDRGIALETSQLHIAYYNRAIAKENTGDIRGAYEDFKAAEDLRPNWDLVKSQLSRFRIG